MAVKKENKIPESRYYDVRIEALVPCFITYRIFATSEEEALIKSQTHQPNHIKHNLSKKRPIKAMIYEAGSSIIKLTKFFRA